MKKKRTHEEFVEELAKINNGIEVISEYTGVDNRVKVRCLRCGNEWSPFASNLLAGRGCRHCSNRKTTEEFISELSLKNPKITVLGEYNKSDTPILVSCNTCHYSWSPTPNSLLCGEGCPKCGKRAMADKHRKSHEQFIQEVALANPFICVLGKYTKSKDPILVRCKVCGHEWNPPAGCLVSPYGCPVCNKRFQTSFPEQAIYYYVKRAYPDAENRFSIPENKMELDIFIPSIKVGIEYDGSRWHKSSESVEKEKHKFNLCKSKGIKLLRVRESLDSVDDIADYCIISSKKYIGIEMALLELSNYIDIHPPFHVQKDVYEIRNAYLSSEYMKQSTAYFVDRMKTINPNITVLGEYTRNNDPIQVQCNTCMYIWSAVPNHLLNGHGCPQCNGKNPYSHSEFVNKIAAINPNIEIVGHFINVKSRIEVKCKKCGRFWSPRAAGLLKGYGCSKCAGMLKKSTDEYISELSSINPTLTILEDYKNSMSNIKTRCNICGYEWYPNAGALIHGSGCPICNNKIKNDQRRKPHTVFVKELKAKSPQIEVLGHYEGTHRPISVRCKICGNTWLAKPNSLLSGSGCKNCGYKKVSAKLSKSPDQFAKELAQKNLNIDLLSSYERSSIKVHVRCRKCGREWDALPTNLLNGHGCKNCSHKKDNLSDTGN